MGNTNAVTAEKIQFGQPVRHRDVQLRAEG